MRQAVQETSENGKKLAPVELAHKAIIITIYYTRCYSTTYHYWYDMHKPQLNNSHYYYLVNK